MNQSVSTQKDELIEEARRLHAAGKLPEAALLYKKIVGDDQNNTDALYEWACVAAARGNYNNAVKLLKTAIKIDPSHVAALSRLGVIYVEYGWYGWAKECFDKAIEREPAYIPARNNLARVLIDMGACWDAEGVCMAAIDIDPDYAPIYATLGKVYRFQGKTEKAIEAFLKALELTDDNDVQAGDLCNLGVVYANLGERAKAASYYKKALEKQPDYVDAHYLLSNVTKYKKGDHHIAQMEAALEKADPSSYDAARLHFGLADARNQTGDYGEAFEHYAQGNYLMRSTFEYDVADSKQEFDEIKKTFKKGFEKNALKKKTSKNIPIFILGMPRSGTTLVEQILSSHPDVGAAGEAVYLDYLRPQHGLGDLEAFGHDACNIPEEKLTSYRRAYLKSLSNHAPEARYITDKMPPNFRYIGLIRLAFPEAKIIHCKRDPMDTCFSIYKHMFAGFFPYSYDLKELGAYYKLYEDMMSFWHKRLPGFIHDVSYEGLVSDQEGVSRKLLGFCGIDWDERVMAFYKQDRAVLTASSLQVRQPLYKKAIESWRKYDKCLSILKKELL